MSEPGFIHKLDLKLKCFLHPGQKTYITILPVHQCDGKETTRDERQLSDDSPPAPQMEQKITTCQMEMEYVVEDGILVSIC